MWNHVSLKIINKTLTALEPLVPARELFGSCPASKNTDKNRSQ